ncbi:hypothetical protein [Chitinophaga defluvii]|uniref:Uncharacterized protein n=1 Tax=Chitinophaga defluvii TaxID=3163343 RepID=A0ABV2T4H8_9BACT
MKKVFALSFLSLVAVVSFAWQTASNQQAPPGPDYNMEIVPLYLMTASCFQDALQGRGNIAPASDIVFPTDIYQCRKPEAFDWNKLKTVITNAVGTYRIH